MQSSSTLQEILGIAAVIVLFVLFLAAKTFHEEMSSKRRQREESEARRRQQEDRAIESVRQNGGTYFSGEIFGQPSRRNLK